MIPTAVDKKLVPDGYHMMSLFTQWVPSDWNEQPHTAELEAYADRMIDCYNEIAPNLKSAILHRDIVGPHEMEHEYGLIGGNIFHGELSLEQLFHMRPAPGFADYRTPVDGLYYGSSATHAGGGVCGIPGWQAARAAIADKKAAGRQHMHLHAAGQCRHLLVEPVPAGDLEGDQAHLPRAARHGQRTVDPAYLQDVDGAGAQGDGPPDRDRIDQAAVEVVLAIDGNRRQQPGHRTRGQHGRHDRPAAEPARAGVLDAGRDALEGQFEVGEVAHWQHVPEHPAQRLDRMQVRARARQPGRAAPQGLAERLLQGGALPQLVQLLRRARRVGGHEGAVDRAPRRAHDHVGPDAGLRQRPEHADLMRPEQAAAAEHERRLHPHASSRPS